MQSAQVGLLLGIATGGGGAGGVLSPAVSGVDCPLHQSHHQGSHHCCCTANQVWLYYGLAYCVMVDVISVVTTNLVNTLNGGLYTLYALCLEPESY